MPVNLLTSGRFNSSAGASPAAGLASVGVTAYGASASTGAGAVTHGEQLTDAALGPWSLQGVGKGSETLESLSAPARGYWRFDTPDEFAPTSTYTYSDSASNKGGVVPAGGLTIDGYSATAGTRVVQFRDFSATDFYIRGSVGSFLFRGCRFRNDAIEGSSHFNDSTATYSMALHFCDMGGTNINTPSGSFWKAIGGSNHRVYRTLISDTWVGLQPNVPNFEITECLIRDIHFAYGELGPNGNGDSAVYHVNGISCEGSASGLLIQRCRITIPSPDTADGSTGSAAGQAGYGTQPGQTGYGSGTNPGRLIPQTDCIAVFAISGSNSGVQIKDNYLGGSGVCLYAGNADGGAQNIVVTGNKVTTRWWTNGGNFGAITDQPSWGSNGNSQSNNTWADDYGTGGNGCTAIADRQYPSGNGPRAGTSFI